MTALSALGLREPIAQGELRALEVAEACLRNDPGALAAWAFRDADFLRAQARGLDSHRAAGQALGPLHGIAVAVQDTIDTLDMPTARGSGLDTARRPEEDATLVGRLRQAGALLAGKSVTAEYGFPGSCSARNPLDPARIAGVAGGGAAAAVAGGEAQLALVSDGAGAVLADASYCGLVAYRPSPGRLSTRGVFALDRAIEGPAVLARDVADAALLAEVLQGFDPQDPATRRVAPEPLLRIACAEPPLAPLFAFAKTSLWDRCAAATREGLSELAEVLSEVPGGLCDEVDLPEVFDNAPVAQRRLLAVGAARALGSKLDRAPEAFSEEVSAAIAEGRGLSALDYLSANDWREVLRAGLEPIFARYDVVLTPAALGEAPLRESAPPPDGAAWNGGLLWSFCGLPAVCLPLLSGEAGLPVGVQLVARRGADAQLLRTAHWLCARVDAIMSEEVLPTGEGRTA